MPATAKHFALEFAGLIWRLAVYFAVLIATFRLLSMGYQLGHTSAGRAIRSGARREAGRSGGLWPGAPSDCGSLCLVHHRAPRPRPAGPDPAVSLECYPASAQGTLWGFAGIGATIGAIACFGGYRVSGLALSGADLAYYLPLWLVVAVVNGLAENLAFMGYPLFRVARTTGWAPAILLVGLVFAAAHLGNPGENPIGIASGS